MTTTRNVALLALVLAAAPSARADEGGALNQAILAYNDSFNAALASTRQAKLVEAALGFYDVEQNSGVDESRFKAQYYLAQSLFELGLPFSALSYYTQLIKAGPSQPFFTRAIEGAVKVAETMKDETFVPTIIDKAYSGEFGNVAPEARGKVHFIIGRGDYRRDKYSEGLKFLRAVPPENPYYASARYIEGLILSRGVPEKGVAPDPDKALKAFEEVRKLQSNDKVKYVDLESVQDLSQVALARLHYALGNYQKSADNYNAIPKYDRAWKPGEPERYSPYWEESLFEGAWADFMNDDPGGALGKLQTLHSPALADSFQPESWVLKATIYYYSCLFEQAKAAVDQYDKIYAPMNETIKPLIEQNREPEYYFNLVAGDQAAGGSALPVPIRLFLEKNERYKGFLNFGAELDKESSFLDAADGLKASQLAKDLLDIIGRQRGGLAVSAGKFIRGRLKDVSDILGNFDGQVEIVRLETSTKEKELLESNDDPISRLNGEALYRPVVPDESYEYWAFQGEYWPDELGFYKYTLKNACPSTDKKK